MLRVSGTGRYGSFGARPSGFQKATNAFQPKIEVSKEKKKRNKKISDTIIKDVKSNSNSTEKRTEKSGEGKADESLYGM